MIKSAITNNKVHKVFLIIMLLISSLMISSCATSAKNAATAASAPQEAQARDASYSESGMAAPSAEPAPNLYDGDGAFGAGEVSLKYSELENTSIQKSTVQRKIIMDGNVTIETYNFDESIQAIDLLIESAEGFAESRTVRGKSNHSRALRYAEYTIRVPAEKFDSVMRDMSTIGTVLESNSSGTDITEQYADLETRIRTLKVQEETLLDILSKATKLEDVITLEGKLSEVRYEIESIENKLRNYDRLVAYSRINIYIQEVDEATETRPVAKTLSERVSSSFSLSLLNFKMGFEDFVVWVVESWITLFFLAIVAVIIIVFIKSKRKKRKLRIEKASVAEKKESAENQE